jgi:hypothetical protein
MQGILLVVPFLHVSGLSTHKTQPIQGLGIHEIGDRPNSSFDSANGTENSICTAALAGEDPVYNIYSLELSYATPMPIHGEVSDITILTVIVPHRHIYKPSQASPLPSIQMITQTRDSPRSFIG